MVISCLKAQVDNIARYMQTVSPKNKLQAIRKRLIEEIEVTRKRKHPSLHPLFNLTMQNKIDHANRILHVVSMCQRTIQAAIDNT